MRQFFKSSAGLVTLIVLGLVLGAAGTATAAKLITGKDIKNGTITNADIKRGTISEDRLGQGVRSKLNTAGEPGAQGPVGPQGIPGERGQQGIRGPQGAPGTSAPGGFVVRDGEGTELPGFVAYNYYWFDRVVDGALWQYAWDGSLVTETIYFPNRDCVGTPVVLWDDEIPPNPQWRFYAANGLGYRAGTDSAMAALNSYLSPSTGQCANTLQPVTYDNVPLEPMTAPSQLKGPLTVHPSP